VLRTVAWGSIPLGTILPVVVAREVFSGAPSWLIAAQVTFLIGLLVATIRIEQLRGLRLYAVVLLVVLVQFHVDWPTAAAFFDVGVTTGFWAWAADRTVSFLFSSTLLVALLVAGYGRERLFLRRGTLSATLEPVGILGLRRERPWRWYAPRWGGAIVLVTVGVLVLGGADFWIAGLSPGGLAIAVPVILLMAAINAFSEEFLFRAAPLMALSDAFGKQGALLLMATVFGLSHFYGTPGGVPGVLMNVFLGWFLGKSILETRGMGFAVSLHFLLDVVVFTLV
jgi:membrane protease YdiL (CAAX protease family)